MRYWGVRVYHVFPIDIKHSPIKICPYIHFESLYFHDWFREKDPTLATNACFNFFVLS